MYTGLAHVYFVIYSLIFKLIRNSAWKKNKNKSFCKWEFCELSS